MSFLPGYKPVIYSGKDGRTMTCLLKHCKVMARPEELVRQRVLHWLLKKRKHSSALLSMEESYTYTNRSRGRSDIVLRNPRGRVGLVVEIKRPEIMLGDAVKSQAIRYARKLRASEIWLTNGDNHRFMKRTNGRWTETSRCQFLGLSFREKEIEVPHPRQQRAVKKFMSDLGKAAEQPAFTNKPYFELVLSLQKMITLSPKSISLPFSHRGLHILEDRGLSQETIATPAGGYWNALYRMFLAATEGRVETVGLGLNVWDRNRVILCVAFIKPHRKHHSLQLQLTENSTKTKGGYSVSHSGRMGGRSIPTEKVIEAVVEAGREDLVIDQDGGQRIALGTVPSFDRINWRSSREFIGNLFHYALIRSNLREGNPYTKL